MQRFDQRVEISFRLARKVAYSIGAFVVRYSQCHPSLLQLNIF